MKESVRLWMRNVQRGDGLGKKGEVGVDRRVVEVESLIHDFFLSFLDLEGKFVGGRIQESDKFQKSVVVVPSYNITSV